MKAIELETSLPELRLVEPDVERDAQLGVAWLHGEMGRNTLRLMGVADANNKESDIESERERITDFIENPDHLNWMLEYDGEVVGAIWVNLKKVDDLPPPALHIMVGDPKVRGKGVGTASSSAVIEYLKGQGEAYVYSRHLTANEGAAKLLASLGFQSDGKPYTDGEGLNWQNVSLSLE